MNTIPKESIIKLIEAGIQAPSADNGQPWKFKLLQDGFELWLDHNNMGLFFDVHQIATRISCGALIENVVAMANASGLSTHINTVNEPVNANKDISKFAHLSFTPTANKNNVNDVIAAIYNRHSNRNLFQFNRKIPEPLMAELTDLVQSTKNYRLQGYTASENKKAIIKIITATDTIRFIHEQIHHDFYKVLRFGDNAQRTRDGLAAATLGIESLLIPLLKRLRPWSVTRLLNHIGLHHIMAFRGTWLPMKSASNIVSITHCGSADYVESGRIMQRFWLQANKAGLSVQALGALPLFLARLHLAQGEGFTQTQLDTISKLEEDFVKITPKFSKESDQIVMLFRLGYGNKVATRSYRRTIESFLIT